MRIKRSIVTIILIISFSIGVRADDENEYRSSYENYGREKYSGYAANSSYSFYDQFGNLVTTGYEIFNFSDINNNDTSNPGSSSILKGYRYNRWFNELVAIYDNFDGTFHKVMIGDELRIKFNDYIVNKPAFNGIRYDLGSRYIDFSLIGSRISDPVEILNTSWRDYDTASKTIYYDETKSGYAVASHISVKIAKHTLGVTYANIHTDDNDISKSSIYGTGTGNTGLGLYGMDLSGEMNAFTDEDKILYKISINRSINYQDGESPSMKDILNSSAANLYRVLYIYKSFKIGGDFFNISDEYTTSYDNSDYNINNFKWVDDNDDNDQFPDEIDQLPLSQIDSSLYFTLPDGVFPGPDKNKDGVSDYNENKNQVPDYDEDFIAFKVDPPQYEVGFDYNNNGIVDIYENDSKPDFPYDTDLKGEKIFLQAKIFKFFDILIGRLSEKSISDENQKSDSLYVNINYIIDNSFLNSQLSFFYKKVKDTIPNDYILFEPSTTDVPIVYYMKNMQAPGVATGDLGSYTSISDPLLYKDSTEYVFYNNIKFLRYKNVFAGVKSKFSVLERNSGGIIKYSKFIGSVTRFSYYIRLSRRIKFTPVMLKNELEYNSGLSPVNDMRNYYIGKLRFKFTPRTAFTAGYQFMNYVDNLEGSNNQQSQTLLFNITSRSIYKQYNIGFNAGYLYKVVNIYGSSTPIKNSVIFLRTYITM